MTTRFYLPASGAADVTVTPSASWGTTTSYGALHAQVVKSNTALAAGTARTHSATNNGRRLDRQFVSDPIGAGTISGTFSAVIKGTESSLSDNAWLDVIIRVVSGNGATVRGVLYAGSANTSSSATTTNENYEYTTSTVTRIKNAITLTSQTAQNGDRIVIEIGHQYASTTTTYTVTNTYGDPSATADFALTVDLATALCPWVQLSQTLAPYNLASGSTALAVTAAAPAAGTKTVWRTSSSGTQILKDGATWLINGATTNGAPSDPSDAVLSANLAVNLGVDLLRLTDFLNTAGVLGTAEYDPTVWARVDNQIALAGARGLVVELDFSCFRNLLQAQSTSFNMYTYDWSPFLKFVANRVNTVTGNRYGSDPTIAVVAFAGESGAPDQGGTIARGITGPQLITFFDTVMTLWGVLAPRQLRTPGGFFFLTDSTMPWREISSLASCDLPGVHSYSSDDEASQPAFAAYCASVRQSLLSTSSIGVRRARRRGRSYLQQFTVGANKPWIVEEMGFAAGNYASDALRAVDFTRQHDLATRNGAGGVTWWNCDLGTVVPSTAPATAAAVRKYTNITHAGGQFQFFKFQPTALRTPGGLVQLADFALLNGATVLPGIVTTGLAYTGTSYEGPEHAADTLTSTKWCSNTGVTDGLIFDLGFPTVVTGYQWITGNDSTDRDPVQWVLSGSIDGTTWYPIDTQTAPTVTLTRLAAVGPFTVGLCGFAAPPAVTATLTADGGVSTALSSGSTTIAVTAAASAAGTAMRILNRVAGTATASGAAVTSIAPVVGTGAVAGDLSILAVAAKPYSTTITTPGGWMKIGEGASGATASGLNTGSMKVAIYAKVGALDGETVPVAQSGADSMQAAVLTYYSTTLAGWDFTSFGFGGQDTPGATYSATSGAPMALAVADELVTFTAVQTNGGTRSAAAFTTTGLTQMGATGYQSSGTSTGNHAGLYVRDIEFSKGPATTAPVFGYSCDTSVGGETAFLRIRESGDYWPLSTPIAVTAAITANGIVGVVVPSTVVAVTATIPTSSNTYAVVATSTATVVTASATTQGRAVAASTAIPVSAAITGQLRLGVLSGSAMAGTAVLQAAASASAISSSTGISAAATLTGQLQLGLAAASVTTAEPATVTAQGTVGVVSASTITAEIGTVSAAGGTDRRSNTTATPVVEASAGQLQVGVVSASTPSIVTAAPVAAGVGNHSDGGTIAVTATFTATSQSRATSIATSVTAVLAATGIVGMWSPSGFTTTTTGVRIGISEDTPAGSTHNTQVALHEYGVIGRRVDLIHVYHLWDSSFVTTDEAARLAAGQSVLYCWQTKRNGSNIAPTWADISSGSEDAVIDAAAARALTLTGAPLYLNFQNEPETSIGTPGSGLLGTAAQFKTAWQRIHDRFATAGVTNVVWVFNVTGVMTSGAQASVLALYPGDTYVDWVSYDPYNWAGARGTLWTNFTAMIQPWHDWARANLTSAHPYMLAEYGSVEDSATPDLQDSFTGDLSLWPNSTASSIVGGRARITCNTASTALKSGTTYLFQSGAIQARVYAPSTGGAATAVTVGMRIESPTSGTFLSIEANVVTGTLIMANKAGFSDGNQVSITYDPVAHAWWRIREASGTVYWETSPDNVTWTNRRTTNASTPGWIATVGQDVSFPVKRDSGTVDYAEIASVTSVSTRAGADTGRKAAFFTEAQQVLMSGAFPAIQALVYFDHVGSGGSSATPAGWLLNSSTPAQAAYRQLAQDVQGITTVTVSVTANGHVAFAGSSTVTGVTCAPTATAGACLAAVTTAATATTVVAGAAGLFAATSPVSVIGSATVAGFNSITYNSTAPAVVASLTAAGGGSGTAAVAAVAAVTANGSVIQSGTAVPTAVTGILSGQGTVGMTGAAVVGVTAAVAAVGGDLGSSGATVAVGLVAAGSTGYASTSTMPPVSVVVSANGTRPLTSGSSPAVVTAGTSAVGVGDHSSGTSMAVTSAITANGSVVWTNPATAVVVTATRTGALTGVSGSVRPVVSAMLAAGSAGSTSTAAALAVTAARPASGGGQAATTASGVTAAIPASGGVYLPGAVSALPVTASTTVAGGATGGSVALVCTTSLGAAGTVTWISGAVLPVTSALQTAIRTGGDAVLPVTVNPSSLGAALATSVSTAVAAGPTADGSGNLSGASTTLSGSISVTGGGVTAVPKTGDVVSTVSVDMVAVGLLTGAPSTPTPVAISFAAEGVGDRASAANNLSVTAASLSATCTSYVGAATSLAAPVTATGTATLSLPVTSSAVFASMSGDGTINHPVNIVVPIIATTTASGAITAGLFGNAPLAVTATGTGGGVPATVASSPSVAVTATVASNGRTGVSSATTAMSVTETTQVGVRSVGASQPSLISVGCTAGGVAATGSGNLSQDASSTAVAATATAVGRVAFNSAAQLNIAVAVPVAGAGQRYAAAAITSTVVSGNSAGVTTRVVPTTPLVVTAVRVAAGVGATAANTGATAVSITAVAGGIAAASGGAQLTVTLTAAVGASARSTEGDVPCTLTVQATATGTVNQHWTSYAVTAVSAQVTATGAANQLGTVSVATGITALTTAAGVASERRPIFTTATAAVARITAAGDVHIASVIFNVRGPHGMLIRVSGPRPYPLTVTGPRKESLL